MFLKRSFSYFLLLSLIISPLLHAKSDGLIVYGDQWMFTFNIPSNWEQHAQKDTLEKYLCHAAVFRSESDVKKGGPIIQITAYPKTKGGTLDDFNYDKEKEQRSSQTPSRIEDTKIENSKYKTYSYVSSKPDGGWSVVTYLDTSSGLRHDLSAVINLGRKPTQDEMAVYQSLVASLKIFNIDLQKKP